MDSVFTMRNGIKCYAPEALDSYQDYTPEGFDLTQNEKPNFWSRSRNRLLKYIIESCCDKLLKTARLSKGPLRLLELGSCTGDFLSILRQNQSLQLIGSDLYIDGLISAKSRFPEIDWIQINPSQHIPLSDLDIVCAFDVIEHIEDDVSTLKNIYDSLKPSSYAVITVPQYQFLFGNLDILVKHKRRYSKQELEWKIKSAGFTIEYSGSFVFCLFPLMLLSRVLDGFRKIDANNTKEHHAERTSFSPFVDFLFDQIMKVDEYLIRRGFSLPFGGSLIAVIKKG